MVVGTDGPGDHTLHLLDGGVDDAALIGVHGLQRVAATGAGGLSAQAASQGHQSLLTLLAVVADVQSHTIVGVVGAVGHQTGQILQSIQGLATTADDKAQVLAIQGDDAAVVLLGDRDGKILHAQTGQNGTQIRLGSGGGGAAHHGALDDGGGAAEQTQHLLLGLLHDLEGDGVLGDAQLGHDQGLSLLDGGGLFDDFLIHCCYPPLRFRRQTRRYHSTAQQEWLWVPSTFSEKYRPERGPWPWPLLPARRPARPDGQP